jgi:hypothetical protein
MTKYLRGRSCDVKPFPRTAFPAISAEAVTVCHQSNLPHERPKMALTEENDVEPLENITHDVEIPSCEDKNDGCSKGDRCRSRVLPLRHVSSRFTSQIRQQGYTYAEKTIEHRVVVLLGVSSRDCAFENPRRGYLTGQRLAGSSWLFWCSSSIRKVGELSLGLLLLCLCTLGQRAVGDAIDRRVNQRFTLRHFR